MVDLCITKANGKREPIQCQKRTKKFKLKTRNLKTKFERWNYSTEIVNQWNTKEKNVNHKITWKKMNTFLCKNDHFCVGPY